MDYQPGDVLLTSDPKTGWRTAGFWVKLRAIFVGESSEHDHVAVVSHRDESGVMWAIEARPGGVGWVDAEHYARNPSTLANTGQPKTDEQRKTIVEVAGGLLGKPYDWVSIIRLGMDAVDADAKWRAKAWGKDEVPAHMICSALAAWVYDRAGLAYPTVHSLRFVTPGDWDKFIAKRGWETAQSTGAVT